MKDNFNYRGIISLWAVAECGIGGIMHGMKIPFTGIIVGGISIVCLYFISKYSANKKTAIIEATATVISIKLMASPHSPWQAYVAVMFQSLMAIVFLTGERINLAQTFLFSIITQIESAVQRILIMVLVFGNNFFKALDESAIKLVKSLGLSFDGSFVIPVFVGYLVLHFCTGLILGYWLPRIEKDVQILHENNPTLPDSNIEWSPKKNKKMWGMVIMGLFIPLLISYILNDKSYLFTFLRVMAITTIFIFVLTPVLKYFIRMVSKSSQNKGFVEEIISQLPRLINHYARHIKWASSQYKGLDKIKYTLVALVYASYSANAK
jgi:hypothetical protein